MLYAAPSDRLALLYAPGSATSVHTMMGALLTGASLHCLDPRTLGAGELLESLRTHALTAMGAPTTLLRELMPLAEATGGLPSLRLVTTGGQTVYAQDVAAFQRAFGPQAVLLLAYGLSEAGTATNAFMDADTQIVDARVPVGYALPDRELLILDETGNRLGAGELGEIVLRSPYLARGYWQDPEQDAARYRPGPENPGGRLCFSGDLGLLRADGCLEHHGRRDAMVKIRGYRVELGAVETALLTHPGVAMAAVIAHPLGNEQSILVAYVTALGDDAPRADDLRRYLDARLPAYMIPARFVFLPEMPMTANGKIAIRRLPPPGVDRPDLATPYCAPETPTQVDLAALWSDVLGIERVGIDDDFAALGGNSLQVARILAAVQRHWGRMIALQAWIGTPTIRHLTRLIEDESAAASPVTFTTTMPPRRRSLSLPMRIIARLTRKGPIARGQSIPYALGTRLQRVWLRLPIVRHGVMGKSIELHTTWRQIVGLNDPHGSHLEHFLLNNSWVNWRAAHLRQPAIQARWVHMQHTDVIRAAHARGRGAILVFLHMGPPRQFMEEMMYTYGFAETTTLGALPPQPDAKTDLAVRVTLLQRGSDVLGRKGVVFIAGDGLTGGGGVVHSFYGRPIMFMRGPAYLAVEHGTPLIPFLHRVRLDGHVEVEFAPPLFPLEHGLRDARIDELNGRYVANLGAQWATAVLPYSRIHQLRDWLAHSATLLESGVTP